jgi:hypothetical protein
MQRAGGVDLTLIVNSDETFIQQGSRLAAANRPLTHDGKILSWTGGVKNQIAWTMRLNSDGQTALVTRLFAGTTTIATFKRVPTNSHDDLTQPGPRRKGKRLPQSN